MRTSLTQRVDILQANQPDGRYRELRDRAIADFWVFVSEVLQLPFLVEEIHKPWCQWAQDLTNKRRMRLEPRGTGKTALLVSAFSLWLIAQKEVLETTGDNIRILIASDGGQVAIDIGRSIDRHVRRNPLFTACFGEWGGKPWNKEQKTVKQRTHALASPTIQIAGKGMQLTGSHFDVALIDDIVTTKDRNSQVERELTAQWMKDLYSLVEPNALVQMTGTRWSFSDYYATILTEINPGLIAIGQEPFDVIIESVYGEDGQSRFEAMGLTADKLAEIQQSKGLMDFSSQYLNRPVAAEHLPFKEEELTLGDIPPGLRMFGFVDPGLGKRTGDYSCIVTLGQDGNGQLYCVDIFMERCSIEQLQLVIVQKFEQWQYYRFAAEEFGFEVDTWNRVESDLTRAGIPFKIERVKPIANKEARIQDAEPVIKSVVFAEDWRKRYREPLEQLLMWTPKASQDHDDFPDALTACLSLVGRRGMTEELRERWATDFKREARSHSSLADAINPRHEKNLLTMDF